MKGPEFCKKVDFCFNGADFRDAAIPKAVRTKVNQANIPDELRPYHITVDLEDDYTICIHWESEEWCWDTADVANEIENYYKYYADKLNLEDDILVILRIRSRDSYADKRHYEYNITRYNELKEQRDVLKIPIYAVATSNAVSAGNMISKDKLKVYALSGDSVHWFYQTTGKNFSRAALYLDKTKPYISKDDMGSDARLIGKGAKRRGDGNSTWSGYKVDGTISCYKIIDDDLLTFSNECYVDIDTLKSFNEFPEGLFEQND